MKSVKFKGANAVFAIEQADGLPIPSYISADNNGVITKWHLTLVERIRLLFNGNMWMLTKVYGKPLQPCRLTTKNLMNCDIKNPW